MGHYHLSFGMLRQAAACRKSVKAKVVIWVGGGRDKRKNGDNNIYLVYLLYIVELNSLNSIINKIN